MPRPHASSHFDPDDDRVAGPAGAAVQPAVLVHGHAQPLRGGAAVILDEDADRPRVRVLVAREQPRAPVDPLVADADLDRAAAADVMPPLCVRRADHGDPVAAPAVCDSRRGPAARGAIVIAQGEQRPAAATRRTRAGPRAGSPRANPAPPGPAHRRRETAKDCVQDAAEAAALRLIGQGRRRRRVSRRVGARRRVLSGHGERPQARAPPRAPNRAPQCRVAGRAAACRGPGPVPPWRDPANSGTAGAGRSSAPFERRGP